MARLLYPDIGDCRALVIDGNMTSRSILSGMLRDMGVGHVAHASRAADARRMLEGRSFDVVLCDYHFDHSPMSGQDLLDDLRRSQLLPYATVFVMVTGEAGYTHVAEAAEAALDSYLLKPHTASALEQRVLQARHRKKVLGPIFEAIAVEDFETAARLCQERFEQRGEYWLYAARVGAELWVRLNQLDKARYLYEAVREARAAPWAKLGIARVELESGQLQQATRTLESLIGEQPTYADAYDVMGRVQVEQGDMTAALETYRSATELTPASIGRLQKQGMLAFYMGESTEATDALERTVRIGIGSKMFDCQSLVLLVLLHHDTRDTKAFTRACGHLERAAEKRPQSIRLRRFLETARILQALIERQVGNAMRAAGTLAGQIRDEDFDFEAAANLLAALSRMSGTEIQLPDGDAWVTELAQRFCASKASTDMLCLACASHPPYEAIVRAAHQTITTAAEKAMTNSLNGAHEATVRTLLALGGSTLNAKLLDMAGLVLHRHGAKIPDSASLGDAIAGLRRRFCTRGTQVALGTSAGRSSGGLTLRH
jgi:CheY-like chemotaxis protein